MRETERPPCFSHLAQRLGFGNHKSATRILNGQLESGLKVSMNLDGSAAWQTRSADDLLSEFLEPFQNGRPTEDVAHFLAINDGRLLEWMEGVDKTPLTDALKSLITGEVSEEATHIRFISLNQRSLVGSIAPDLKSIDTDFLDRLLDALYGGENAP